MAHPYIVLAKYPSSSSSKVYEVRRGGDGVLYCAGCLGWAHSKSAPKMCKHTKDYVAKNPGTSYGPQYVVQEASAARQAAKVRNFGERVVVSGAGPATKAGADWRAMLLAEKKAAIARGVPQEKAALDMYTRDLDLDAIEAAVSVAPAVRDLDMD